MKPTSRFNPLIRVTPAGLAAVVVATISSQAAHAASLYWDTGAAGATVVDPGTTGVWNTTATNWKSASTKAAWTSGSVGVFAGVGAAVSSTLNTNAGADGTSNGASSSYPVTLGSAVTAAGISFTNTGYYLSASSALTLTLSINNSTGGVPTAANTALWVANGKTANLGNNLTLALSATGFGSRIGLDAGSTLNIGSGAKIDKTAGASRDLVFATVASGVATVNVSGTITGSVASYTGGIVFGNNAGEVDVNVLNGGVISTASTGASNSNGSIALGNTNTATGVLTMSTGSTVTASDAVTTDAQAGLKLGTVTGASGIANLNGGTLTVQKVFKGAGSGTFNFNGGTLKPVVTTTAFMSGLTSANVKAGGALIDSNGYDITVAQPLLHDSGLGSTADGGLTKSGNGSLTLSASNTYTGNTTVNGGTLVLGTNSSTQFILGANHVSNKITGTGSIVISGTFSIDLSGASNLVGNTWTIVDVTTLSETFDSNFLITNWTEISPGIWQNSTGKYEFRTSTGVVSRIGNPLDVDDDNLDDAWEVTYFGNITVTNNPNADPDGDHNTNGQESAANSDPTSNSSWPDSDGDGLNDGWEVFTFGNLTTATYDDTDGDGLLDAWEDQYFGDNSSSVEPSDLTLQTGSGDPDGDLATNKQEQTAGTDPNDPNSWPDSDGDGVNDAWEILTFGTLATATATDHDGDGLADLWEDQYYGNNDGVVTPTDLTGANSPAADPDGDGSYNYQESRAGTDPNNSASFQDLNGDGLSDGHLLIADDAGGTSSFNTGLNWDTHTAPAAGISPASLTYMVYGRSVRSPSTGADYTFVGDRLIIAANGSTKGTLVWKSSGYLSFPSLVLDGAVVNQAAANGSTVELKGSISVTDTSELFGNNGLIIVTAPISGDGQLNITGGNNVTFAGTNVWLGNLNVTGKFVLGNGTSGSLAFKPMAGGATNSISGTGTATLNGAFNIDLSGAGTTIGESWSLVAASTLTESYGAAFNIPGFTVGSGTAGSRIWNKDAGSIYYQFNETTGVLSVVNPDTDFDGLADNWEISYFGTIAAYDGTGDPDGDHATNEMEETAVTNPNSNSSWPDSDGDGLNDGWEIFTFGNLVTASITDTDGDGYQDSDEIAWFGNLGQSRRTDFDGDGASNGQEDADTTDKTNSASFIDVNGDGLADGAMLVAVDAGGTSSFDSALHWDDGFAPSSGINYLVAGVTIGSGLRTAAIAGNVTFQGARLVLANTSNVDANLIVKNTGVVNIPYLGLDGAWINQAAGSTITLAGNAIHVTRTSELWANNGNIIVNAPLSGSAQLNITGGNTVTLAGANNFTGFLNLTDHAGATGNVHKLTLSSTGTLKFVPTSNGVNNAITGAGTVTLNGTFNIDLTNASATIGDYWTLISSTGTTTYGSSFAVAGFTANSAAVGSRVWSKTVSGHNYQYAEATGVLSVVATSDSDGDGLLDSWEITYFGSTSAQDGAGDPDGDGASNLTEYRLGLLPNNGASRFKASIAPNGTISWPSTTGVTFKIERSTNLESGSWITLQASFAGTVGTADYTDPSPPAGKAFYRVTLNP